MADPPTISALSSAHEMTRPLLSMRRAVSVAVMVAVAHSLHGSSAGAVVGELLLLVLGIVVEVGAAEVVVVDAAVVLVDSLVVDAAVVVGAAEELVLANVVVPVLVEGIAVVVDVVASVVVVAVVLVVVMHVTRTEHVAVLPEGSIAVTPTMTGAELRQSMKGGKNPTVTPHASEALIMRLLREKLVGSETVKSCLQAMSGAVTSRTTTLVLQVPSLPLSSTTESVTGTGEARAESQFKTAGTTALATIRHWSVEPLSTSVVEMVAVPALDRTTEAGLQRATGLIKSDTFTKQPSMTVPSLLEAATAMRRVPRSLHASCDGVTMLDLGRQKASPKVMIAPITVELTITNPCGGIAKFTGESEQVMEGTVTQGCSWAAPSKELW